MHERYETLKISTEIFVRIVNGITAFMRTFKLYIARAVQTIYNVKLGVDIGTHIYKRTSFSMFY